MYRGNCSKNKTVASSIPNCGGEQLAVGGEASQSFDESFSEHEPKPSSFCGCKNCRTVHLSGDKRTLQCHYCDSGFLVRLNDADELAFGCIDCGKVFERLPFIVRLCGELEEDIRYWQADFQSRSDPERALANWQQVYGQLAKLVNAENRRMIQLTLQLARAYATLKDYQHAAELNHTAIKALLGYELESVTDKGAVNDIVSLIEQVHEDTVAAVEAKGEMATVATAIYSTEMQQLKGKLDELEPQLSHSSSAST